MKLYMLLHLHEDSRKNQQTDARDSWADGGPFMKESLLLEWDYEKNGHAAPPARRLTAGEYWFIIQAIHSCILEA